MELKVGIAYKGWEALSHAREGYALRGNVSMSMPWTS